MQMVYLILYQIHNIMNSYTLFTQSLQVPQLITPSVSIHVLYFEYV